MFEQAKKHLPLVLALKDQQASFETIIQKLREAGASQITSIKVLKTCFDLTLSQADQLVLNSKAWADHYETTVKIRDQFWEVLANEENAVIDGDHISVTIDLTKEEDESNHQNE